MRVGAAAICGTLAALVGAAVTGKGWVGLLALLTVLTAIAMIELLDRGGPEGYV